MYKIRIAHIKKWEKDWKKVPLIQRENIKKKILELKTNPWPAGLSIKKLKDYPIADYRLRVGEYRILLDRNDDENEVVLFRIHHRSKLY